VCTVVTEISLKRIDSVLVKYNVVTLCDQDAQAGFCSQRVFGIPHELRMRRKVNSSTLSVFSTTSTKADLEGIPESPGTVFNFYDSNALVGITV
jgi:hypothetical protein